MNINKKYVFGGFGGCVSYHRDSAANHGSESGSNCKKSNDIRVLSF